MRNPPLSVPAHARLLFPPMPCPLARSSNIAAQIYFQPTPPFHINASSICLFIETPKVDPKPRGSSQLDMGSYRDKRGP